MPRLASPRPHCPQPVSRGDRAGWEGSGAPRSLPRRKLKGRPGTLRSQIPLGTGAWWPHRTHLCCPVGAATSKILCPHKPGRMEGCGASACPPAQPHLGWPRHSVGATPVTSASVSKHSCWDAAWDHPCAQGRGCQPPASPSRGQGKGTDSLLDLGKPKPPKLHEQFPTGGQQWGQCWGGQGGQPGRLQVSDQANLAASQGWSESRQGSKATNLTHPPG